MFYPTLRHASSNSIIDISSIQNISSNHSTHLLHSPSTKYSYNQNRIQPEKSSYFSHHQLCHSYSNDSLDKQFLENTKQTVKKIFLKTNFNEILHQIEGSLQPLTEQLRQQIERKKYLSKQDRFICIKSCAKFITETLLHDQWDIDNHFTELYHLQQILNRLLLKQKIDISVQTTQDLELDMMRLNIDTNKDLSSSEKKNPVLSTSTKPPRVSFLPTAERQSHSVRTSNDLIQQKNYHRSVSRAFQKLNNDLQKMNHETPFKAHLSKYHKHDH